MTKPEQHLDQHIIRLLLSIAETPDATISNAVLEGFHQSAGVILKATGLIQENVYDQASVSLVDHDDAPVSLIWSSENNSYGYFSPTAGWVTVPSDQLVTYGINFDVLISQLLKQFDRSEIGSPVTLLPGILWEVGDLRLPNRTRQVPVWIGRRFSDPKIWRKFSELIRNRPAPGMRAVLSLTPTDRLLERMLQGHDIIYVPDVTGHYNGFAIDPELLSARIATGDFQSKSPITMSADGGVITVRGKSYTFRGSKQRGIIRQLYKAWRRGDPVCLTAVVLEEAEFNDSVNTLAKAFSRRTDWREFIKEKDGHCWIFL